MDPKMVPFENIIFGKGKKQECLNSIYQIDDYTKNAVSLYGSNLDIEAKSHISQAISLCREKRKKNRWIFVDWNSTHFLIQIKGNLGEFEKIKKLNLDGNYLEELTDFNPSILMANNSQGVLYLHVISIYDSVF